MFDGDLTVTDLAREERTPKLRAPSADSKSDAKPREAPPREAPAQDKKPAPDAQEQKPQDKRPFWRRRPLLTVSLVALTAVLLVGGYVYYDESTHFETTDDAFIAARQIALAPQVTGYVTKVPVTDNQHVEAGQIIAEIDPRDYQAALDQANAQVAAAKASIANAQAQADVQRAQIQASQAQVKQAKAALDFAKQQAARYQTLASKGAGTVQNAQQYNSQLTQQESSVASAEAGEKVAERQIDALAAQLASARANLSVTQAQRETAALNLGYTTIRASEPGRVVNLSAAPGEFAQPGTALATFVPDDIWVVANYKETQLDRMRPGQPVEIGIDAYPGREWKGHVASVQPGSGTAFSLLPAENATGNYVKIVQRVPVKVVLDARPSDVALGPGMSVEPDVRVDPSPSIWERIVGKAREWRGR